MIFQKIRYFWFWRVPITTGKNISEIMGSKVTGTPYTIIGNKVFSGYDYENSKGRFKGAIEYYSKYGYEDKVG